MLRKCNKNRSFNLLLLLASFLLIHLQCSTKALREYNTMNINFETASVVTNSNEIYTIRISNESAIMSCLNSAYFFKNKNRAFISVDPTNADSRTIIRSAIPHHEISKISNDATLRYKLGISPLGDVMMLRVIDYEGELSLKQVEKIGLYLFNMKFSHDEQAPCMEYLMKTINIKNH